MITNKFKKKGVVESDDEEVSINLDNDTYPDMSPSFVVMAPPSGDPTATYVNATRIIAIAMSSIIFFSMASRPGLGNIFSWHPIFMTLGCSFFMTEGMMAYVSRVPEVSRAVARKKHAKYQILALACIMLGYMAVFISHEKNSKSHLGLNDDTTFSRGIHVFLGLLILILCVVQGVFGIRKYLRYTRRQVKIVKWHGILGRYIFFAALGNLSIAISFWDAYSNAVKGFLIFFTLSLALSVLVLLRFFPMHGGADGGGAFQAIPIQ